MILDGLSFKLKQIRWRFIKRWFKHQWQWVTRGFSDQELWNLDQTIASFIAPRLKAFKSYTHAHPASMTEEEWDIRLDKMINAFELVRDWEHLACSSRNDKNYTQVVNEIEEGLKLFGEHFQSLWD